MTAAPNPSVYGTPSYTLTLPPTFTLTNNGTRAVGVSGAAITGTDAASFSVVLGNNCTGAVPNPGQSCSVQVVFRPTATGPLQAQLSFATDAPGSPHVVALYGVGVTTIATLDQFQLDFGDALVGVESAPRTVTVTNRNAGPLTLGPVTSPDARFVVQEVADRPAPRRADHRIVFQHARQRDHLGVREFAPEVPDRRDAIHHRDQQIHHRHSGPQSPSAPSAPSPTTSIAGSSPRNIRKP